MRIDTTSNEFIKQTLIYQDLVKLSRVPLIGKFSSSNIVQYYQYGLVHILAQYRYQHEAGVDIATEYGHVSVLNWLINSNLELKYSVWAFDSDGWFLHSGLPLKYNCNIIDRVAARGHIHVLEWLQQNIAKPRLYSTVSINAKLNFSDDAMDVAAKQAHIAVLEWFRINIDPDDLPYSYSIWAVNHAAENGHISVLDWFKAHSLPFKFSPYALHFAKLNGHIGVLNWFATHYSQ